MKKWIIGGSIIALIVFIVAVIYNINTKEKFEEQWEQADIEMYETIYNEDNEITEEIEVVETQEIIETQEVEIVPIEHNEVWESEIAELVKQDETNEFADMPMEISIPDGAVEFDERLELINVDENKLALFQTDAAKEVMRKMCTKKDNSLYNVFLEFPDEYDRGYLCNTYYITFDQEVVYYLYEYPELNIAYILKDDTQSYNDIMSRQGN